MTLSSSSPCRCGWQPSSQSGVLGPTRVGEWLLDHNYVPHIALIGDERPPRPTRHTARRWVVERTLAWLSKCRGLLVRYEKNAENYLGLLKLACGLLWFRRYLRLTGSR